MTRVDDTVCTGAVILAFPINIFQDEVNLALGFIATIFVVLVDCFLVPISVSFQTGLDSHMTIPRPTSNAMQTY